VLLHVYDVIYVGVDVVGGGVIVAGYGECDVYVV